jgi:ankyrin repeat protein
LLLARLADVEARDNSGATPLCNSASLRRGSEALTELMLAHGADVRAKDRNGSTPLHHAANIGAIGSAKALIARGAEVNARDNNGRTPLYWAMKRLESGNPSLFRSHGFDGDYDFAAVSKLLRDCGGIVA